VRLVEARRNDDFCYTPAEAALVLRVSPTRVRQLLQDGELEGERDEVGHWLIPARAVHERLERLRRESFLEAVSYDPSIVHAMQERVEVLRAQVEMLRAELQEAHAANRENRRIIAALTQRIPELEPPRGQDVPQVPPQPPVTAADQPGSSQPRSDTPSQQESVASPWWRRVFGA
jgi:excisionase family DNA binding protein